MEYAWKNADSLRWPLGYMPVYSTFWVCTTVQSISFDSVSVYLYVYLYLICI